MCMQNCEMHSPLAVVAVDFVVDVVLGVVASAGGCVVVFIVVAGIVGSSSCVVVVAALVVGAVLADAEVVDVEARSGVEVVDNNCGDVAIVDDVDNVVEATIKYKKHILNYFIRRYRYSTLQAPMDGSCGMRVYRPQSDKPFAG